MRSKPKSSSRFFHGLCLQVCFCLVAHLASAAETDPDGRRYEASPDPVADLRQALGRAAEADRQALVILGANWCHDSRALAARLHKSPLKEVIQQHYELEFVDVGYLDKGRAVLDELDVAQFYATPTVLIVDPSNGAVVNDADRHIWGNAYNIDMATSVGYFEQWATREEPADAATKSATLHRLYAQIDRFERQQAKRVAAGYAVVGPLLKAYKEGDAPEQFNARWDELRDFRTAIVQDIRKLRDEAIRQEAEGEQDIQLVFPHYPALSWESE